MRDGTTCRQSYCSWLCMPQVIIGDLRKDLSFCLPQSCVPYQMSKSCKNLFDSLIRCLSDSECVQRHPNEERALKDCAAPDAAGVDDACKAIRVAYSQCRKSQLDMRRRIRGAPNF